MTGQLERSTLPTCIWGAIAFFSTVAIAPPTLAQTIVPDGSTPTIVSPDGNQTDISGGTVTGANLFHSFSEFGVETGGVANFITTPDINNILGRVTGGNASYVNGLIQVSGGNSNLFLMNPAGIVFGQNASLNVPADFTATTATGIGFESGWLGLENETNWSQLVGDPIAFDFSNLGSGVIVNEGVLSVPFGHQLGLLAGTIVNTGTLRSPGGNITIAAVPGENLVRLSAPGNLLNLEFVPSANNSLPATHSPLPELLTGGNIDSTNSSITTNNDGTISIAGSGVRIEPQTGDAIVSGTVDITHLGGLSGAEAHPSTVQILGDRVAVLNANIDASGASGGGNIFIGGNFQGLGVLPNARTTFIDANTQILADAWEAGNGGEVIIWADDTTQFYGNISARGGVLGGDGGFVEVSGKENLAFGGLVQLEAVAGELGQLLLDPGTVIINASGGNDAEVSDGIIESGDGGAADFTISSGAVVSALDMADVTIQAQNNITVTSAIDASGNTQVSSLSLEAGDSVNVNASVTLNGGNLNLTGGAVSVGEAIAIATNGGNVTIDGNSTTGSGVLIGSPIDTSGGAIDINGTTSYDGAAGIEIDSDGSLNSGSGNITVTGTNTYTGTGSGAAGIYIGGTIDTTSGNINLTGTGGTGTSANYGIFVDDGTISAIDGTVSLDGTAAGNGNGTENTGIHIRGTSPGSRIEITGAGDLRATGVAGNGTSFNSGFALAEAGISVQDGDITILGTGNGTVENNNGINGRTGGFTVNGSGNISLTGIAGNGASNNVGVSLGSSRTTSGSITIEGTGRGTGTGNYGILHRGLIDSDTGNVFLTGTGTAGSEDISFEKIPSFPASFPSRIEGNNVTLTANTVDPMDDVAIAGSGTFTWQPRDPGFDIEVLSEWETRLVDGFTNIVFGHPEGSGTVTVGEVLTFPDPVTFQSPSGTIEYNNDVTADALTFIGNDINVSLETISTPGGDVSFQGNTNIATGLTIDTSGGSIDFTGMVSGSDSLILNAGAGNISFGDAVEVASLDANTSGTTNIASSITTTDTQNFSGNVNVTGDASLDAGGAIAIAGDVTGTETSGLTVRTPSLDANAIQTGSGGIDIETTDALALTAIETTGDANFVTEGNLSADSVAVEGNADFTAGGTAVIGDMTGGTSISVTADGDVEVGAVSTFGAIGGDISLTSNNGMLSAGDLNSGGTQDGSSVSVSADGNVQLGSINTSGGAGGGDVDLNSANGSLTVGNIDALGSAIGGAVTAAADGNLSVGTIGTSAGGSGGDIGLTSNNGTIDAGNLDASAGQNGGTVTVLANGDFSIGNVDTSSNEDGGDISVTSNTGIATAGNLNSSGGDRGGDITVVAELAITTGQIDSSSSRGAAGNVSLDPIGDIEIGFINAEGDTTGGNVDIVAGQFFRATDTFVAADGDLASISTLDSGEGGSVSITHGGDGTTPFVIGDASTNGTAGRVTSGSNTFEIGESFLFTETRGNIGAISVDATPVVEPTVIEPPVIDIEIPVIEISPPVEPMPTVEPPPTVEPMPTVEPPPTVEPTLIVEPPPTVETTPTVEPPTVVETPAIEPTPVEPTPVVEPISPVEPVPADRIETQDFQRQEIEIEFPVDRVLALDPEGNTQGDRSRVRLDSLFASGNAEGNLDVAIASIEDYRNQEFGSYLGLDAPPVDGEFIAPEIQATLKSIKTETGVNAAVVYTISREEGLELVVVPLEGEPVHYSVPEATPDALRSTVGNLIYTLTTPRLRATTDYLEPAQTLYRWLISPIESDLKQLEIDTLLFSLDPGLRSLPLATLYDGESFLIERYRFSIIPSFSLTDLAYRRRDTVEVLAMGVSQFRTLEPLPAVPTELELVSGNFKQSATAIDESSTLDNFLDRRNAIEADIVHLATHANFSSGAPENSYIQLWNQRLNLPQIPQLNLNSPVANLLVLSACRTALGDREAELGFGGLAIQSGAQSVLASLWEVSDEGTLGLMGQFYRNLSEDNLILKSEALRQAQLAMIRGEIQFVGGQLQLGERTIAVPPDILNSPDLPLNHPYYWSGFTTIGSPW